MNLIKRVISIAICVIILFLSPVSVYFSANNISTVHASGPVALTAEAIYVLCQYLGSLGMAYAPVQRPDLPTDEEVLEFGYNVLVELDSLMFGPHTYDEYGNEVFVIYDPFGQPYVYGSEALQEAAETEFTVIQGAGNPDDNNDDDDESKKTGNHLLECWRAGELFVAAGAVLGDCITDIIYDAYSNYINGEPSLYDDVLGNLGEQTFTDYDSIQNADGTYNVKAYSTALSVENNKTYRYEYIYEGKSTVGKKPFAIVTGDDIVLYQYYSQSDYRFLYLNRIIYRDGVLIGNATVSDVHYSGIYSGTINIPVFASIESALLAFEADDFTSALNFAKAYREADWLAEDWTGKLIDPLTGLNALSNFSNIARHQGLNALGNELTPDDYVDYLRDYFANHGTDKLPEVDPAVAPVVFSGVMPAVTIDPARNPVIQPVSDPGTNPGTNPDPGTSIDPAPGMGIGPKEEIDLDEELPGMPETFLPLAEQMKIKFPFSIPWDLKYLFDKLSSQGCEPPRWVLPFVIESIDLKGELVIDLKNFEPVSKISRLFLTLLFCLGLINMTIKIVGMRKEE